MLVYYVLGTVLWNMWGRGTCDSLYNLVMFMDECLSTWKPNCLGTGGTTVIQETL